MPKPSKPEIELAVAGQKAKASTYNDNFQTMLDYVDDCMDYAVLADLSNLDATGEAHFVKPDVAVTHTANTSVGSSSIPVHVSSAGVATVCTGLNISNLCNTSSSNITSNTDKPCVVQQHYVSGSSWYRVWSDGWIEQGGRVTTKGANSITFLKSYTTTNYTILGAPSADINSSYGFAMIIDTTSIAKTGFSAYWGYTAGSYNGGWWYTAGY